MHLPDPRNVAEGIPACFCKPDLSSVLLLCFGLFFVKYDGLLCLFFPTSNSFTDQLASCPMNFWHGRIMKDLRKRHAVSAVKSDSLRGSILVLPEMIFGTLLKYISFSALAGMGDTNESCAALCRWEGSRWFTGFGGANSLPSHVLCCLMGSLQLWDHCCIS